jgi:TetR/AcrR family transcriptional regulator, transcriptional repressor for nem operon
MPAGTRASLIDHATGMVRRQGYSGFSYADLAEAVGIRKASIHHHFPTKEDLGHTVVTTSSQIFQERLEHIDDTTDHAMTRIELLAEIYREGLAVGQGCLCGVLASEYAILPAKVQDALRRFLELQLRWIEKTLTEGHDSGQVRPGVEPSREAKTVLATLEGAVLIALPLRDLDAFELAVSGLVHGLGVDSRTP